MTPVSDSTPRPSHTTMAAGMVIAGSVLVVLTAAQQLSTLNSLETREMVTTFLTSTPGTGLSVSGALVVLRVALMVAAGCATAAALLGYQVLRRNRRARLGLSVLAVPLFVAGLASGGFLTSLVAISAMLLWLEPSRAWLDRTPLPERRTGPGRSRPDGAGPPAPPWPPALPPSDRQPQDQPTTQPTTQPENQPGPSGAAGPPPPHPGFFGASPPAHVRPVAGRRPDAVVWACVLTWASSGLALVLLAASLTLLLADPSLVWTELERQDPDLVADSGLARGDLLQVTYLTLGVASAWALVAVVLAVLAYRRTAAGRSGLLVCAGVAGVVCAVAAVGSLVMLLPAAACLTTIVLLSRPDVRAWFAAARPHP